MNITDSSICLANKYSIWNFYATVSEAGTEQLLNDTLDPSYEIMTYGGYLERERKELLKPETEITEVQFDDMLNCLPPLKWTRRGSIEWFFMSEFYTGTYTNQYTRRGNQYFQKMVDVTDKTTWSEGTNN